MEASLAVVQVGITVVGAVAAATGGAGVQEQFSPYVQQWGLSKTLADVVVLAMLVIPLTFVTIVFAELVPKMIALHNNEWVVLRLSPIMRILSRAAHPVVWHHRKARSRPWCSCCRTRPQRKAERRASGCTSCGPPCRWPGPPSCWASGRRRSSWRRRRCPPVPSATSSSRRQDMSMIYVGSTLMEALVQAHMDMHTRFPVCTEAERSAERRDLREFQGHRRGDAGQSQGPEPQGDLTADQEGPGGHGAVELCWR